MKKPGPWNKKASRWYGLLYRFGSFGIARRVVKQQTRKIALAVYYTRNVFHIVFNTIESRVISADKTIICIEIDNYRQQRTGKRVHFRLTDMLCSVIFWYYIICRKNNSKNRHKKSTYIVSAFLELLTGIEPVTSSLPRTRSTIWAIAALSYISD